MVLIVCDIQQLVLLLLVQKLMLLLLSLIDQHICFSSPFPGTQWGTCKLIVTSSFVVVAVEKRSQCWLLYMAAGSPCYYCNQNQKGSSCSSRVQCWQVTKGYLLWKTLLSISLLVFFDPVRLKSEIACLRRENHEGSFFFPNPRLQSLTREIEREKPTNRWSSLSRPRSAYTREQQASTHKLSFFLSPQFKSHKYDPWKQFLATQVVAYTAGFWCFLPLIIIIFPSSNSEISPRQMLRLGLEEFARRISGNSTTLFHPLKESLSQKASQTTVNNSITFRQAFLNETSPTASLCQEATALTKSKVSTISMTACCCSNKAFKNVFTIRRRRRRRKEKWGDRRGLTLIEHAQRCGSFSSCCCRSRRSRLRLMYLKLVKKSVLIETHGWQETSVVATTVNWPGPVPKSTTKQRKSE